MEIKEALRWSTEKLSKGGINSASLDAEILLSFVLKKPKEFLYAYPEKKLAFWQILRLKRLINKRLKNWPIAYLTHEKEFYGYNFYVNRRVLIPRPLTEQMIERVFPEIQKRIANPSALPGTGRESRIAIADIGTGSGNIIIALIKKLEKEKYNLDDFKFYATDISAAALKVAEKNARRHGVLKYITFLKGDLLTPLKNSEIDLLLANLPYLNVTEVQKEPSIQKEPREALIGDFYPQLFKQINQLWPKPLIIFEDKTGIGSC